MTQQESGASQSDGDTKARLRGSIKASSHHKVKHIGTQLRIAEIITVQVQVKYKFTLM